MEKIFTKLFEMGITGVMLSIVLWFTNAKDKFITAQYTAELKAGRETELEFRAALKEVNKETQALLFKNMEMQTEMLRMQTETAQVLKQNVSMNKCLGVAIEQQTVYLKAMS